MIRFILLFLAIMIFTVWLFQTCFLGLVYQRVREKDMERAAKSIAECINSDHLAQTVYSYSKDDMLNISVYRIEGDQAIRVDMRQSEMEENISLTSPQGKAELYAKAKESDGVYHTHLTFGGKEIQQTLIQRLFPWMNVREGDNSIREMIRMVYVHLCYDVNGGEYMLLLHTELEPMTPLVHTLQRQFFWIFGILLVISLVFVIPMTKRTVRPLVQMNTAAKQLAAGNYEADFGEDHSYRETRDLAETLTYASAELSKTDKMQKELTANISHDLRTPLTMIRGYAEVMRDIPGENTPENLQVLIDETEHLTELVNDLMDISKLQSGVRSPMMEFFDLTSVLREVMMRYEAFTKAQGYQISLEADVNVPVFADRSMILQAVYNLVNNAINYTGADLKVTVKQTVENNVVRISVLDTGEGIPEDQIPLIWDRYYKVDKVHRSARVGTGLGLSIVKGVLQVHNANYGVNSTPGEGSVFWFELPVSAPPEQHEP